MKSTTTSLSRMSISITKTENLSQKLTQTVSLISSKSPDKTRPVSETKFLKTWKTFWAGSEEKSKKKESESPSSWRTLINLDMGTSPKTNSDSHSTWPKFLCQKRNFNSFWTITIVKIRLDTFSGKDLFRTWIKFSDWKNSKKLYQTKNSTWLRQLSITVEIRFRNKNLKLPTKSS